VNFFERQAGARRQGRRLVVLFALAVLATVAAVDVVLMLAFGGLGRGGSGGGMLGPLVASTVVTVAVIGCASLYRTASLRTGGSAVAGQLGAVLVPEDTTDFNLRRLRNVVEEIAIASGVPVPQVYVLEQEQAINAFAAGFAPADAAITVTRGALDKLNRDELQGVIAHEFSHVLNGDMRLNIRLVGLLFGILVLAIIGRKILEGARFSRGKNNGALFGIAFGLVVVGYVGLFFGRLIKAGLSRSREHLADASAVQFTRQTRGIAGALKKLAGLPEGSRLATADAEEYSHMFFGEGTRLSSMMATHPPLLQRIQLLEPAFKADALRDLSARWTMHPPVGLDEDAALGLAPAGEGARGDERATAEAGLPAQRVTVAITPPAVVAQVATPRADDYRQAGTIHQAIPEVLQRAARHQSDVVPMLLGLLHAPAGPVRDAQQYELRARAGQALAEQALDYAERLADLHPALRLPLASLAFPMLRRRPRPELQQFMDLVFALVHADGKIDLFEYCLGTLLRTQVTEALDPAAAWVPGRLRLHDATGPAVTLLSVVAQAGHDNPADAPRAFVAGLDRVFPRLSASYAPPADMLAALDAVLPQLDGLEPMGKELLIEGLVVAVSHDGRVTVSESELLRTVCASLHVPLPPMLADPALPRAAG
jgi:Zn-dependent protease with chaperone function